MTCVFPQVFFALFSAERFLRNNLIENYPQRKNPLGSASGDFFQRSYYKKWCRLVDSNHRPTHYECGEDKNFSGGEIFDAAGEFADKLASGSDACEAPQTD